MKDELQPFSIDRFVKPLFDTPSFDGGVLGSARVAGQEIKEKVGKPLSTSAQNLQKWSYGKFTEGLDKISPSTYIEPKLKEMGLSTGLTFAIGLTADFLTPMPDEWNRVKKFVEPLAGASKELKLAEEVRKENILYHGTSEQFLENISKDGLKPMSRGVTSLSKNETYAKSFAESSKFPRKEGQGIMLRIKSDAVETTPSVSGVPADKLNELLTKQTIPPQDIEIFENGKWQPLIKNNPLFQEARKYKTAEEFVKAKGKTFYHGGGESIAEFVDKGRGGVFLTSDKKMAQIHADFLKWKSNGTKEGVITEAYANPKKIYKISKMESETATELADNLVEQPELHKTEIERLKSKGYDAIQSSDGRQLFVFDPKNVQTKSQLTDIWKRANIDERLVPLADKDGMVTVYRASAKFPETLPKDTYVSTKPDSVRYYAESWYKGNLSDIKVKSFKVPASKLKRGGTQDNWQLTEDFLWKKANKKK